MEHRYAVGDRVSLAFGFHDTDAVGVYSVIRQLPFVAGNEPQYRVKGADNRERSLARRRLKAQAGKPAGPNDRAALKMR